MERIAQCEEFEKKEDPTMLAPLVGNPDLIKVAVAWTRLDLPKPGNMFQREDSDSENARWHDLWSIWGSLWTTLTADLSVATGLPPHSITSLIRILIYHRLIYPDGRMAKKAEQFISGQLLSYIRGNKPNQ